MVYGETEINSINVQQSYNMASKCCSSSNKKPALVKLVFCIPIGVIY